MPQVKLSDQARYDLGRFADFLTQNGAPEKASEVISFILKSLKILRANPLIGRDYPLAENYDFQELVMHYGKNGYVALYSFDQEIDLVVIHAIRHQLEFGYNTASSE